MANEFKIEEVPFNELEGNILAASISEAGIIKVDQRAGSMVYNTIEPQTYIRHRRKDKAPLDRNDKYYPWGEDNQFPLFLLHLKAMSTTLRTIVNQITRIAMGKGLTVLDDERPEVATAFKDWLRAVGANANFHRTLFANLVFFKGFFIEYEYGALGVDDDGELARDWGLLNKVHVLKTTQVRKGRHNVMGEIEKFYFHREQFEVKKRKSVNSGDLLAIDVFPGVEEASENEDAVTVHDYTGENAFFQPDPDYPLLDSLNRGRYISFHHLSDLESDIYPTPDCAADSAINAALLDAYIPQYDTASLVNGLTTSHIVVVPLARPRKGASDGEKAKHKQDKDAIQANLQNNMTGVDNADNILVLFKDPKSETDPVQIAAIPNNDDAATLDSKSNRAERVLLAAYTVPHPSLVGINAPAGKNLNQDRNMLNNAEGLFYSNYAHTLTELAEEWYAEVMIPMFALESGLDTSTLRAAFPWSQRFKKEVPSEVLLKTMTLEEIFEYFGLDIKPDEEYRRQLVADLLVRSLGGNTADPALLAALGVIPEDAVPEEPAPNNTQTQQTE